MELELGPPVSALLRASASLSNAQLGSCAVASVEAVTGSRAAEGVLGEGASCAPALREGLAGLAALFAEASRLQLSGAEVCSALQEQGSFSATQAQLVVSALEEGRARLRDTLLRTAWSPAVPQLAGSRWRCDLSVGGSGRRGAPLPLTFHLVLLTLPRAATRAGAPALDATDALQGGALPCTLSLEQLQQLSFTLKGALAAAYRAAGDE